jgi:hypothetical protein
VLEEQAQRGQQHSFAGAAEVTAGRGAGLERGTPQRHAQGSFTLPTKAVSVQPEGDGCDNQVPLLQWAAHIRGFVPCFTDIISSSKIYSINAAKHVAGSLAEDSVEQDTVLLLKVTRSSYRGTIAVLHWPSTSRPLWFQKSYSL